MDRKGKKAYRKKTSNRTWVKPQPIVEHVKEVSTDFDPQCICQRDKGLVLCRVCSFNMIGRVRTLCPSHPKTIFLMDLDQCPQCHAYSFMIKEYPMEKS